jgi:Zn ribbon nucleic-acid-binding protein
MTTLKFNKTIIITIITLIIGLLVGAGTVYLVNQQNVVSKEEARKIISNFIKQQQLPPDTDISIVNIVSEKGLYKITIDSQGQKRDFYLSKDGSLFFPEAWDLTALLATPPASAPAPTPEQEQGVQFTPGQLEGLAKCLVEKGVKFYGTAWCPACNRQKEMFRESAQYLPYVECYERYATEQELAQCREAGITSIPDWRFPDGQQQLGLQTIQRLADLSGCSL